MQFEVSLVFAFIVIFLGVISLAIFRAWNGANAVTIRTGLEREYSQTIYQLQQELEKTKTAVANWKGRYRRGWDIYADEDEEIDPDADQDIQLSELAKIVYPKLPPALGKLIDQPQLQEAIMKKAASNPDLIGGLIDKFLPKEGTNTPKLKETYA